MGVIVLGDSGSETFPELFVYYSFDEFMESVVIDLLGNGYYGTIFGVTWVLDVFFCSDGGFCGDGMKVLWE